MAYEYTRKTNLWEDVCTLVSYDTYVDDDGIVRRGDKHEREVFCLVGSLYQKEFFMADQAGINAQWQINVWLPDYNDETEVILDGKTYAVYRKFINGDTIDLLLRNDGGTLNGN